MRRPDLPLILLVFGAAGALAILVDPAETSPPEAGTAAQAPLSDLLESPPAGLLRCLTADVPPSRDFAAPSEADAVIEEVSRQVEELRQLRFSEPIDARFLEAEELQTEIDALLEKELKPDEIADEQEVLVLLGAIPPGTDLGALTREALGGQIIGLYETRKEELLVQSSGETDSFELITLAHELQHALSDQAIGIRDDPGDIETADRTLAYAAVVEGDASLLMQRYALAYVGLAEQLEVQEQAVPGAADFASLPDYVQRNSVFPYLEGLRLVCHRYLKGGWKAVDELYREPPESTDEVLFPGRYGDGPPADPRASGKPHGWTSTVRRELGAAELQWLFAAPGGDPEAELPEPRALVASWAGGELELWARGAERALGISLVELPQAERLCGAMAAWYGAGHPQATTDRPEQGGLDAVFSEPEQTAALSCRGDEIRMGIAPSQAAAVQLAR